MTHCLDTNVFSALLSGEPSAPQIAHTLGTLRLTGSLLIHGSVYAELLAVPGRTSHGLDIYLACGV